jgi:hypothetical protein
MRAVIFSIEGRNRLAVDDIARDLGVAEWKVPTTGTSLAHKAISDTLGDEGSCTWSTSNFPSANHRRTRATARGPKATLATEPFHLTGTALPALVT